MSISYVPGNPKHTSGANGPVTRVVLHATVSPCQNGGAMATAHYFQSDNAGGLAHYVVDPAAAVQCAHEDTATWHAPPNKGSIGIELCDPQAGDDSRWQDAAHEAMLHRAAALFADVCKRHALPLVYVDAAGLRAGHKGITTHHQVTLAFGQSTHTDPDKAGPFPLAHFMQLVRAAAAASSTAKPAPAPVQHPLPHPKPYHYVRTLREGMQGQDVRHMQGRLGAHVDGDFGPHTLAALKAFQKAHALVPDGVCGHKTQTKLG